MNEATRPHSGSTSDQILDRTTLTVAETASLLGIGRSAAYEAVRRGQIPSRRLGRRIVVPVPALLDWLGSRSSELNDSAA